jgi:hypothetical protein
MLAGRPAVSRQRGDQQRVALVGVEVGEGV